MPYHITGQSSSESSSPVGPLAPRSAFDDERVPKLASFDRIAMTISDESFAAHLFGQKSAVSDKRSVPPRSARFHRHIYGRERIETYSGTQTFSERHIPIMFRIFDFIFAKIGLLGIPEMCSCVICTSSSLYVDDFFHRFPTQRKSDVKAGDNGFLSPLHGCHAAKCSDDFFWS